MTRDYSDERLNALIDDELTPSDAAPLLEQLRTDPALRDRVSQLRLAKDLVRHAYGEVAPRAEIAVPTKSIRWRAGTAALVAIACGAVFGWMARAHVVVTVDPLAEIVAPGASSRIVLHVSSASPQLGLAVLDRAEGILETARASGRTVSVEIVANSGGLDLLRQGVSAHADRIANLRAAYSNLALVACGQTAQRLREEGNEVRLLPGTFTATSALDEIVLRMQQGWAYVRI